MGCKNGEISGSSERDSVKLQADMSNNINIFKI